MGYLISEGYREQLKQVEWGGGGHKWASKIQKRITLFPSPTVLDYGCGSGSLRKQLRDCLVREYDPAVSGKDQDPEPADIVVCVDVLEHIEPDKLQRVLQHLYNLTIKMALFVIATRPAEKRLPDDRNAHLIIDNAAWWHRQLKQFPWVIEMMTSDKDEFYVWVRKD